MANARSRAGALEYLDNVMSGQLRHRLVPILENLPLEEKVRRGNVLLKTRPRDVEETLLELINDDESGRGGRGDRPRRRKGPMGPA